MAESVSLHYVEELQELRAWLRTHLETNVIHRQTGNGGHDGNGSSWSAVAIPEWSVRQKIAEIDETLSA